MEKLKIACPVIVEGKYDRLRLLSVIEAQIITTDGFGLFKKNEKAALIRALAQKSRIIVLTDSDGAGRVIRSRISQMVPPDKLIQLHIPRIAGKEKRKSEPSAEGVLGVEGMEAELLYKMFAPYAGDALPAPAENPLSKTDFYVDGLSGGQDSAAKRDKLAAAFGLPPGMTANSLLAALRLVCTYEEYLKQVGR
ncbi:MAG: DUF4093 domain-containing protein [Clostridia bacterium]|nr:DUF4093 domain-containing protein [Clostridia bacterium]